MSGENPVQLQNLLIIIDLVAYKMKEWADCMGVNGFFTKPGCYFLVDAGSAISWNQIFHQCERKGGIPARFYDTKDLMTHFWSFHLHNVCSSFLKPRSMARSVGRGGYEH